MVTPATVHDAQRKDHRSDFLTAILHKTEVFHFFVTSTDVISPVRKTILISASNTKGRWSFELSLKIGSLAFGLFGL